MKHKAIGDGQGGHIEEDMGYCEWHATDEYRERYRNIWGDRCVVCRDLIDNKGMEVCQACINKEDNHVCTTNKSTNL